MTVGPAYSVQLYSLLVYEGRTKLAGPPQSCMHGPESGRVNSIRSLS
jgi:hypothetical protein